MDPLVRRLLVKARAILADGGDPHPCEIGAYCLRCCVAIAQTDLSDELGDGPPGLAAVFLPPGAWPADARIEAAVGLVRAAGDDGIRHTRESALGMIDVVLAEGGGG